MAFPSLTTQPSSTAGAGATTSHTVPLPNGISTGDLLIVLWGHRSETSGITWPSGWTQLVVPTVHGDGSYTYAAAYRVVDGTEGFTGTGDDITVTTAASVEAARIACLIAGQDGAEDPEISSVVESFFTAVNPPSLSPSWGSADTLWLAVSIADANQTTTQTPGTPFGNHVVVGESGSGCQVDLVSAEDTSASLDPEPRYEFSSGNQLAAFTLAVKGASATNHTDELTDSVGLDDTVVASQHHTVTITDDLGVTDQAIGYALPFPGAVLALRASDYSGSGDWLDQSGHGHHATPINSPTWDGEKFTIGAPSPAKGFIVPDHPDLEPGTGPFTVVAIASFPEMSGIGVWAGKNAPSFSTTDEGWFLPVTSTQVGYRQGNEQEAPGSPNPDDDAFTVYGLRDEDVRHVLAFQRLVPYDTYGKAGRVSVDGAVTEVNPPSNQGDITFAGDLAIGAKMPSMTGYMAPEGTQLWGLVVFRRVLDATEIQQVADWIAGHRTVTDEVGVTDTVEVTTSSLHTRTASDSVGVVDGGSFTSDARRDPVPITDSATYHLGVSHQRVLTDTVGIEDVGAFVAGLIRELVGISDTVLVNNTTKTRTLVEALVVLDQGEAVPGRESDPAPISDEVLVDLQKPAQGHTRTVSDPVIVPDDGTYALPANKEPIGISDSIVVTGVPPQRTISDAVGILDEGLANPYGADDRMGISDSLSVRLEDRILRSLVEQVGVLDTRSFGPTLPIQHVRTIEDGLDIGDEGLAVPRRPDIPSSMDFRSWVRFRKLPRLV